MKARVFFTITLISATLLALSACGGGGGNLGTSLNFVPDEDYNLLFSVQPARMYASPLVRFLLEDVDEDDRDDMLDEFEDFFRVELPEMQLLTGFYELSINNISQRQMGNILFHGTGPFDDRDLENILEDRFLVTNIEDEEEEGLEYYLGNWPGGQKVGYFMLRNGFVAGLEDSLEDAIDLKQKGGKRLRDNEDFAEAYRLLDQGAMAHVLLWDINDFAKLAAKALSNSVQDNKLEDFFDEIEELEAVGISVTFTNGIRKVIKARFEDEKAARAVAEFLEDDLDDLLETLQDRSFVLGSPLSLQGYSFDDFIDDLEDSMSVRTEGNVVVLIFDIKQDSELIETWKDQLEEWRD